MLLACMEAKHESTATIKLFLHLLKRAQRDRSGQSSWEPHWRGIVTDEHSANMKALAEEIPMTKVGGKLCRENVTCELHFAKQVRHHAPKNEDAKKYWVTMLTEALHAESPSACDAKWAELWDWINHPDYQERRGMMRLFAFVDTQIDSMHILTLMIINELKQNRQCVLAQISNQLRLRYLSSRYVIGQYPMNLAK